MHCTPLLSSDGENIVYLCYLLYVQFDKTCEEVFQTAWTVWTVSMISRETRDEKRKKEEKTEEPHSHCLMHNDAADAAAAEAVVTQEYFLRFN